MAITNYGELKSAISDFLNRSDLTSVIPTFIDFAEAEFNRILRIRQMVARAEAVIDARFSAVPADFLEAIFIFSKNISLEIIQPPSSAIMSFC